jgi:DNA-binding transcriptional LysR family regulator
MHRRTVLPLPGRSVDAGARREEPGPILVAGASIAVVAAITAGMLMWFTPAYMVNDDLALAMFASGGYTGDPSPHLVFMGIVPGLVLWALYGISASVAWYPLASIHRLGSGEVMRVSA